MKNSIGIDVSKEKLDVCVLFGDKIRTKVVQNSEKGFKQLLAWIEKLQISDPHICMESTGCYSEPVAEFFHQSGLEVSVVNPLCIKAFRNCKLVRQKTDSSDAFVIAEFCRQNSPAPWKPKSPEIKELHEISLRIDSLKAELNRIINCLEKKNLSKLVLKSIKTEANCLQKLIEQLETEAKNIVESNQEIKLKFEILTSVKGVGEKTALTVISEIPDVENFQKSEQFAAFSGVTPSHFQSGSSVKGKSHISKIGSTKIRNKLYMSALCVKNHNPYFQNFVLKLQRKGKPPKVIIVAVMRKLMSIFFGMLKNSSHFDENLAFAR